MLQTAAQNTNPDDLDCESDVPFTVPPHSTQVVLTPQTSCRSVNIHLLLIKEAVVVIDGYMDVDVITRWQIDDQPTAE